MAKDDTNKISNILRYVKEEHKRIIAHFGEALPKEKRTLLRTIKLMEEVGELCNEILHAEKAQRTSKLQDSSIDEEMADVMVVLLMLAKNLDIDLIEATNKKVEILKTRKKNY